MGIERFKGASLLALAIALLSIHLVFISTFTGTTSASPSPIVHCLNVGSDNNRITLFCDVNGDGVYEQVSTDGKRLTVKDINEQILWSIPTTATLTDIGSDVDGDGISDIAVSTSRKTLFYDGHGALIKIVSVENDTADNSYETSESISTTPVWWYDSVSKSVCWRADLAKEKFFVDFDGDHSTYALTDWSFWHYEYGICCNLGIAKRVPDGVNFAWAFRIGELRIDGPSAHINKADWWGPTTTEWFYYYVDDTIPPTDWIVHLQRSDGVNPIPVTEPFWYSEDWGSTWSFFNTLPGENVQITPTPGVSVTFSSVTAGGITTATTSTAGPPPPTANKIVGIADQPIYYDITTTATYSGPVYVCINYDETQVAGPEANLKLMQKVDGWKDITTSVDTGNDIICGTTTTFSLFIVAEPLLPAPPVGGIVIPVDKFALLAPWIILAVLITIAAVSIVVYRRRLVSED